MQASPAPAVWAPHVFAPRVHGQDPCKRRTTPGAAPAGRCTFPWASSVCVPPGATRRGLRLQATITRSYEATPWHLGAISTCAEWHCDLTLKAHGRCTLPMHKKSDSGVVRSEKPSPPLPSHCQPGASRVQKGTQVVRPPCVRRRTHTRFGPARRDCRRQAAYMLLVHLAVWCQASRRREWHIATGALQSQPQAKRLFPHHIMTRWGLCARSR